MDEEVAILAAIAMHPEEDTPRLAYADWLDEHGRHIHAEFIRVQIEIKKYEHLPSSQQQGYADLYRRQDAILTHHRRELLGSLGETFTDVEMTRDVVFDRGFVTELTLDAERFREHFAAVGAIRPRPEVRVTGAAAILGELTTTLDHDEGVITRLVLERHWAAEPVTFPPEWLHDLGYAGMSRLWELNCAECRFGDDGLRWLLAAEDRLAALTHLDLSYNEISDDGVRLLVASPLWPRLRKLVLDGNPISNVGADLLADAPPTRIEHLDLRFTGLTQAGHRRVLGRGGWNVGLF